MGIFKDNQLNFNRVIREVHKSHFPQKKEFLKLEKPVKSIITGFFIFIQFGSDKFGRLTIENCF
jgi:hypothetical protein